MNAIAHAPRGWRRLTWRHWAWTIAVPVLVALSMPLQVFPSNRYWAFWQMLYNIPWYVFIALLFLGAILAAEASSARPATAAWRYVGSMIVASAICVGMAGTFHDRFPRPPRTVEMGQTLEPRTDLGPVERERRNRTHVMLRALTPLLYGWLATFVYITLRYARLASQTLAVAEIGRSEAQRRLFAAQLLDAEARVDPAFVLHRLDEIERAYEMEPAKADGELDDLIAFLRAAIPRIRAEEPPETEHEPQGSPG